MLNPHTVDIFTEDMPSLGARAGDILTIDRDQRVIIIDRTANRVKKAIAVDGSSWLHTAALGKHGDGVIVADYSAHFVKKLGFDGSVKWTASLRNASKISVIEGALASGMVTNSFGGDYLVAANGDRAGVYELRDSDGSVAWSVEWRHNGGLNVFALFKPHSAFRMGAPELNGALTIIGFEAGGGIVAVDYEGRPRFGLMKTYTLYSSSGKRYYRPTRYGLMETTHVFPTLRGTIGAIDWSGRFGSRVIEVLEMPKAPLWFLAAQDWDPGDNISFIDPPLETFEYDEVKLSLINSGPNPVTWYVYATDMAYNDPSQDFPTKWKLIYSTNVLPGFYDEFEAPRRYAALRIGARRTYTGMPARCYIIAIYK